MVSLRLTRCFFWTKVGQHGASSVGTLMQQQSSHFYRLASFIRSIRELCFFETHCGAAGRTRRELECTRASLLPQQCCRRGCKQGFDLCSNHGLPPPPRVQSQILLVRKISLRRTALLWKSSCSRHGTAGALHLKDRAVFRPPN